MNTILVIARLTFREAVRRKIALAAALLGLAFLILFNIGLYFMMEDIRDSGTQVIFQQEIYNFIFMAGLYVVNFLALAMSALLAADTLAGEIASGAIQAVVTKPVRRRDIVLGKWLGFAGLLVGYLLLMGGGLGLSTYLQGRYLAPNLLLGLGLIYFNTLVIMSVTLVCSSMLSTLATGGVVFGLYGLAFIGGWVEQIGAMLQNQTAVNIGIISSFLLPTEALWRRAAAEMTSPLANFVGTTPFTPAEVPSNLMLFYAGLYLLGMLWIATRQFNRRDL